MLRTIVLDVDFPELIADDVVRTVKPVVMFSELLTNFSSATVKDNFNMKTELLDTHLFELEVRQRCRRNTSRARLVLPRAYQQPNCMCRYGRKEHVRADYLLHI